MSQNPYTITDWQRQLLSEIFRIILKEIRFDEDKEKLAPGEVGISYDEGCFYVRNPYTGELFCPNSIAHIKQIISKFDSKTNLLNADRVSGIRFYSDIGQLTQLGITLSADSIIRQMEYPSILMSPVTYTNYATMGFPSDNGLLVVYKVNPEFVMCTYYDCNTYTTYDGRYNRFKHMFEGWSISGSADSDYLESTGGGDLIGVRGDNAITDMMVITMRVTDTISNGAKLSYNGGEYLPILDRNGSALSSVITANNIIMLIYDDQRKGWIWLSSTESSINAVLDITNARLDSMTKRLEYIAKDYQEKLSNMKLYVDTQLANHIAQPGRIIEVISTFTASTNATDTIPKIKDFNPVLDKLVINYNQTILRLDIDYVIEATGGIQLRNFTLNSGDTLQFIVFKQAATAQQSAKD